MKLLGVEELTAVFESFQVNLSSLVLGWIAIILGLILKEFLTAFTFGMLFYFNKNFDEGDTVFIDGDEAIIQKIGITTTVFKMIETGRWQYVKNEKIRYRRLEKQIERGCK